MSRIKAAIDTLDYGDKNDFLNFQVDGHWLDEMLEQLYPGAGYKGLVPTLDYALNSDEEKEIVWERILPSEGEKVICPILMCPDDCDFSCTLVVAEIENWGNSIVWNRLGVNTDASNLPANVGAKVDWFYTIGALEFPIEEYVVMLRKFKDQFDADEKEHS